MTKAEQLRDAVREAVGQEQPDLTALEDGLDALIAYSRLEGRVSAIKEVRKYVTKEGTYYVHNVWALLDSMLAKDRAELEQS